MFQFYRDYLLNIFYGWEGIWSEKDLSNLSKRGYCTSGHLDHNQFNLLAWDSPIINRIHKQLWYQACGLLVKVSVMKNELDNTVVSAPNLIIGAIWVCVPAEQV